MYRYYEFVEIDGEYMLVSKKTRKIIGREDDEYTYHGDFDE